MSLQIPAPSARPLDSRGLSFRSVGWGLVKGLVRDTKKPRHAGAFSLVNLRAGLELQTPPYRHSRERGNRSTTDECLVIQGLSREASQTRAPAIAGATESAYFFFGMYRSVIVPS